MSLKFVASVLCLSALLFSSCRTTTDISTAKVRNGSLVQQDWHRTVGKLLKSPTAEASCTATLIAEDIAVTAWHCVREDVDHRFFKLDDVDEPARIIRHEKLKGDVALIKLNRKFSGYRFYPLADLPFTGLSQSDNKIDQNDPRVVIFLGYGEGSEHKGKKQWGWMRFSGQMDPDRPTMGHFLPMADRNMQIGCPGDSGGPVFVYLDGQYQIAGVAAVHWYDDRTRRCETANKAGFESVELQRDELEAAKTRLHDYEPRALAGNAAEFFAWCSEGSRASQDKALAWVMKKLNEVDCEWTARSLNGVGAFYFSNSGLTDVTVLRFLPSVTVVTLAGNELTSMPSLANNKSLRSVVLDDNLISDLRPILDASTLETLSIRRNRVSDVSALSSHSELRRIYLQGNPLSSQVCAPRAQCFY